jgi:hypothetical protein
MIDDHAMAGLHPTQRRPRDAFLFLKHLVSCAVLIAVLAGCVTMSLTYNHAERLLLWRIDRYFQLTQEQEGYVKEKLAELHVWHRQTELPRYSEFLRQVQERWQDGVTPEDIDWSFDTFAKLRATLADYIAAPGGAFLTTIDAKQLKHLERVVQRDHRQWQARAGNTPEERAARRAKSAISSLRDWLGPLTKEQERLTQRLVKDMTEATEDWIAYRMQRQDEFVRLLQSRPKPALIEHKIHEWFEAGKHAQASSDSVQRWRGDVKAAVLAIDRTITPRQRSHASEKLLKLIREIQALEPG